MKTKWYCLDNQGDMQYVGEFDSFDDADANAPNGYVWLVREADARVWLKQLRSMLEPAAPITLEDVYTDGIGWAVFDSSERGLEIERMDENLDLFPSWYDDDLIAEWLVHFLAADGDQDAIRALTEIDYSQIDDAMRWEAA